MSKKLRTEAVDYLFDAILSLQNKEECYTFFEDICTINELLSLSQRFEVAKMLREHKTYLEIAEKTGIGDLSHFSKTFKTVTGYSPNAWRKCVRNEEFLSGPKASAKKI